MPDTRRLNPKKLLMSKWTAAHPEHKEKHFLVVTLLEPEQPDAATDMIELEAIYSGKRYTMPWQALLDQNIWLQGWQ